MRSNGSRADAWRVGKPARRRSAFQAVLLATVLVPAALPAQLAVGRVELVMPLADRRSRDVAISVRNEAASPVQAIVRLEDWDRAADGANRWYPYGSKKGSGSCGDALSIFPQALRLEGGASQFIRVVLDSSKAPAGECWAAAVVETAQAGEHLGQKVTYMIRTAVKIYVQPEGLRTEGEIQTLRVATDSASTASSIEVTFCNTGAKHVVTEGVLEVRQADNRVVTKIPLPPVYALPGAHHTVKVPMPKLPPGQYVLLATMDYGGGDIAAALLEHRAK